MQLFVRACFRVSIQPVISQDKWCTFLQHKCGLLDNWCNIQDYGMSSETAAAVWS